MKQKRFIFWGVFVAGFIVQMATRSAGFRELDKKMWADQIQFFLNGDPRVFNFSAAYGHPGTTLVGLGSLFHVLFGFPYLTALSLAMSILISGVSAACAVMCILLYRESLWWLATASVLLFNHLYMNATPPTAVVMPFIVLIVLTCWWLWQQQMRPPGRMAFILLGTAIGASAATRLDATLLISGPMFLLLLARWGRRIALPVFLGAGVSFFLADPFLWFMPIRHISDLVHKFLIHYNAHSRHAITMPIMWIEPLWMAAISFGWALLLLCRRCLGRIIPTPVNLVFIGITLVAVIGILSTKFQAVRYLFPVIIVWEVFLPLFALETLAPADPEYAPIELAPHATVISRSVVAVAALLQLLAYLSYPY